MVTKFNSLSILFYLRKNQLTKDGKAYIMVRITLNKDTASFSSKIKVNPKDWDGTAKRIRTKTAEASTANNKLDEIKVSLTRCFQKMDILEEKITADLLKRTYLGEFDYKETLLGLFDKFINDFKCLVEEGHCRKPSTLCKYKITYKRLSEFMLYKYKVTDIQVYKITHGFVTGFEIYLRTVVKSGTGTLNKYMRQFKTIVLIALNNGWIKDNPFANYKIRTEKPEPRFLTQRELDSIINLKIKFERLERVRDFFVFGCFTGLPYIDIRYLSEDNIITDDDGKMWIYKNREKTNIRSMIPLLEIPLSIMDKYSDNRINGKIFPVPSNQKINAYLKEIADLCGIKKRLTFHVARHTFSTTVTLENGISIESISKMLGHSDIRTTQIYARVTNTKISNEMDTLINKMNANSFKSDTDLRFEHLPIDKKCCI